jgi:isocitrate dehydrogenase (NAD+)
VGHRVTLIPGDGIGPEVTDAARLVVAATGVEIDWDVQPAGAGVVEAEGEPLPNRVLDSIRANRVALKGPITTPVGTGFRSVNVALRQELDLFAAVRPVATLPGIRSRYEDVDLVVIRENTEDLYAGVEFAKGSREVALLCRELQRLTGVELPSDAGVTLKPISASGTRRIVRFAFDYGRHHGRALISAGHKANIMRYSDGLFLQTALEVAGSPSGARFDGRFEAVEIDELALRLVMEPETLDVLLLPNLYGDILSDLSAGLVGGLGLAAGANIGWEYAVFEPVHGSAPDIAGRGVADPIATMLSAAMMLAHVSEHAAAESLRGAVRAVLAEGSFRTPDIGGSSSTVEVARAIAGEVERRTAAGSR